MRKRYHQNNEISCKAPILIIHFRYASTLNEISFLFTGDVEPIGTHTVDGTQRLIITNQTSSGAVGLYYSAPNSIIFGASNAVTTVTCEELQINKTAQVYGLYCNNGPMPNPVTMEEEQPDPDTCEEFSWKRKWTFKKIGIESSFVTEIFNVTEVVQPTIIGISSEYTTLDSCVLPATATGVTAIGTCGIPLSVTVTQNAISCPGNVSRTWIASECQRKTIITQVYNRPADLDAPVLHGIEKLEDIVDCDSIPVPSVTAMDSCDGQVSVVLDEESPETPCEGSLTRHWTATDLCGNTASLTQTFHLMAPCFQTDTPVFFNEILVNNTLSYVELRGKANFDLNGYAVLGISGSVTRRGNVRFIANLEGQKLGPNGKSTKNFLRINLKN